MLPTWRCMQAEEQPLETSGQRSKTASKRARKKAASQQAGTASRAERPSGSAAQPADTVAASDQTPVISCGSTPATGTSLREAGSEVPAAACSMHKTSGIAKLPLPHSTVTAISNINTETEWWRCPLSGAVMRDPVLYGSGGHSFEREALEQWLAANPGVDPLSGQPLPPGGGTLLPNHALRNTLQQLHLG